MIVLITYDVNTENSVGKKRLKNVAKICKDYGQRVQNSVFECEIDNALFLKVKNELIKVIDENKDSLRFYYLGKSRKKIEHFGAKPSFDVTGSLIV